ncbi:MAG: hypothetical protein NXY57DRAFT_985972 [Lentinula lateritia]|uniref:ARID domain-containing protein n=1 Tax=Lentinula lateritia TaxID=40482 RepID=A0ABQ8VHG8_9AGAR|nr:MAG: hypothetical protein NXY57DRAFT_985972 [Lentinula lateritia]KAJ4494381.1 hypothetical protein C8R41DRAFT_829902 [Lentinula lateritia]
MLSQNELSSGSSSKFPFDTALLDAAQAKQMAALTAVGQARTAQGNMRPSNGGGNSGSFLGGIPPGHNNFPNQPLLERSMSQNPAPRPSQPSNTFKEKSSNFIYSLATVFAKRNQPLPPSLTGIPTPTYDPINSPFKDIEAGSEHGSFRLAGKDINIFHLWTMIWHRGGMGNVGKDNNAWAAILQVFDIPESALPTLVQIYSKILLPFESMYRQNLMEQQKKAQAMRQAAASSTPSANNQHPPTSTNTMSPQRGSGMGFPPSQPPSSSVPSSSIQISTGLPPIDGGSAILDGPTLDQDLQGLKRKLEQEEEVKRTRQKTETADSVLPAGSASDQAFVGPSDVNPGPTAQAPTPATMTGHPRTRQELSRRKIEYKPLVRDIETYGGRDLKQVEVELHHSNRRPLRDINDWGTIDIDALTLSIRSKLSIELSYALTTLTLLSTMKGQTPTSGFPINNCPDLFEEVLDLVEDLAFDDVTDSPEAINLQDNPHIVTNREIVDIVYELETQPFAVLERRQGSKHPDLGPRQRPANLILTVINIIRNLSVFGDNVPFLANQPRLLDLLLRVCGVSEKASSYIPTSPVLSLIDCLAIRKDVLYILSLLAPAIRLPEGTTSLSTVRRIFNLITSYLVDPAEAVSPIACVQLAGVPLGGNLRPPSLADIALEVFTRLAHSDGNRLVFSKAVSRPSLWCLFVSLVHRLPLQDLDFQLISREIWLSYVEKIVMALYTLGFIFTPELKSKAKTDRSLGFKNVMMRIIQKLFVQNGAESRQFFIIIVRRIIETLKIIDDAEDSFDNTKGVVSTLSFGMGYGEVGENDIERGTGLLGGYTDIGWNILLCREVQHDDVMFSELESLIRIEH